MSKIERSPLLSVVVCTFERYSLLKGAISSLQSQTLCKNAFEILIIDNSRDEQWALTVAKTYAEFANVRYIYTSEPGLARARNLGLVEAHSDIVVLMDDDAVAEPMWAKALLDGFAAFGRTAGALGGPVIPIWPSARPDCGFRRKPAGDSDLMSATVPI